MSSEEIKQVIMMIIAMIIIIMTIKFESPLVVKEKKKVNKAYNIIRANGSSVTDGIPENWFDENSIPLVDWLPYSFYLNSIEHD